MDASGLDPTVYARVLHDHARVNAVALGRKKRLLG
jgi:hypothetical protein